MTSTSTALWRHPEIHPLDQAEQVRHAALHQRILSIAGAHSKIRFATSMAAEDMVLIDAIAAARASFDLFTLDTGRLHQETIDMVSLTERHYGLRIDRIKPSEAEVSEFVNTYGMNGFYDSETAKKACCQVRKIKLLDQALVGASAWMTGQRREQSVTREELELTELDAARGIPKYNPLFDWTEQDVWSYLIHRKVPLNPLHQLGYPSIGCEPCTRPIRQDENIRAGRWWWLQQENKECGLHVQ